jgi:predicted nuclease with TOPRIM domain
MQSTQDHIPPASQDIPIKEASEDDNDIEMMSSSTYDKDSRSTSTSDIDETNSIDIDNDLEMLDEKPACEHNHVSSVIRNALDLANDPKFMASKGILKYFSKATEEEKQAQLLRDTELQENQYQENNYFVKKLEIEQHQRHQDLNRRRQERFQMRKRSREILTGVHSPNGRKKKG